jgi:hypothetical protein
LNTVMPPPRLRLPPAFVCLACLVLSEAAVAANSFIRVPQDQSLANALANVTAGGTIEIAAGTYAAPQKGFLVRNPGRAFTVRAAAGAVVILSGEGSHPILKLDNNSRARGGRLVFRGLTFRQGLANAAGLGGAVTLVQAEAVFENCSFEDNRADIGSTGGGAVKARDNSALTIVGGAFLRNSSRNRGGALVVRDSTLLVRRVWFADNRTNLPGHIDNASGGAIHVLSSRVEIFDSLFERNQAAWVGGAIFAFGLWGRAEVRLDITRSLFSDNRATPDPCCAVRGASTGGALHTEDHALLRLHQVQILDNRAAIGAGVSTYRARLEVHSSVLRGNRANPGETGAFGGAISALSADFSDGSTDSGAVNRRPASVIVANSLLQGGYPAAEALRFGGCILVSGDGNRVYGEGGVAPAGSVEENRARIEVEGTIFADCDAGDGSSGQGGAMNFGLADATVADSLVIGSDARGPEGAGGGIAIGDQSVLRLSRTTLAGNSAEKQGGALFALGSRLEVSSCQFFANAISPGVAEGLTASRGAAIFTIPQLPAAIGRSRDVTGVVAGSVFSQNDGLPLWDVDPATGPINDVRYDGNQFFSTTFGATVYFNSLAAAGGASVAALNNLEVVRPGRPGTDKSAVANQSLGIAPALATLLAAPFLPPIVAGPGVGASANLLGYAWSGTTASALGAALPARAGLLTALGGDGVTLFVDGSARATARAGDSRCTAGPFLCLNGDRFRAVVDWKSGTSSGSGRAKAITADTGYFWFFQPSNIELVTKVLDATSFSGSYWVFFGGLSDVEFTLTVVDLVTGRERSYRNPQGQLASFGDTAAFPAADSGLARGLAAREGAPRDSASSAANAANCTASATRLCLADGRVAVELTWLPPAGAGGSGRTSPLTTDTGLFWFLQESNIEVIVKVLDGRAINGHYWLFYGALTNLEYRLTITDTVTGATRTYFNPQGKFGSMADVNALAAPTAAALPRRAARPSPPAPPPAQAPPARP